MARVYISAVMDIPLEDAWGVLRDFNALPVYHPFSPRAKSKETCRPTRSAAFAISIPMKAAIFARNC